MCLRQPLNFSSPKTKLQTKVIIYHQICQQNKYKESMMTTEDYLHVFCNCSNERLKVEDAQKCYKCSVAIRSTMHKKINSLGATKANGWIYEASR